jgi:DNA topoisomerase-2
MNTPIIKARKQGKEILFYNEGQYDTWMQTTPHGWEVKYYKGLGTSTSKEFTQYLQEREKHIVHFDWTETCDDSIDKVFNKARADDRKRWLEVYSKHAYVDTSRRKITYTEFIDNELSHFSNYDCIRSIPNVMDGFKPTSSKVRKLVLSIMSCVRSWPLLRSGTTSAFHAILKITKSTLAPSCWS